MVTKIIYTISKTAIVLPINSVILDLSKSTYAKGGKLTYLHKKISGPTYVIPTPTLSKITLTNLPAGVYVFEGRVTNDKKEYRTARVSLTVTMPPAPTANAGAAQTVQLPDVLSLKGSGTGTGITSKWTGAGVIANAASMETNVTGSVAGTSNYTLVVTDQFGRTASAVMAATILPIVPPVKTKHGALVAVGSAQEKIAILKAIGAVASRFSAILTDYDDTLNMFEHATEAGFDVLLSLNWKRVATVGGVRVPNKFLRAEDYPAYRDSIKKILDKYRPAIVSIENEPTTEIFYKDDIQYYIDQLAVAAEVVKSYNIPVADGGIHEVYINQVISGNISGNAVQVKQLIEAYKTIPLDYINVHTNAGGNSLQPGGLKKVADYLRTTTGKKVSCNEYHLTANSASLMSSFIKEWNAGGYEYAIVYSGGKGSEEGGNSPLTIGSTTELTEIGTAFRDRDK